MGIFNFRRSWQIKAITTKTGFLLIPPSNNGVAGERNVSIRMTVPRYLQDEGILECEDMFKIFVTNRATHFRMSLLSMEDLRAMECDHLRGAGVLADFLLEFTGGLRGNGQGKWMCRNFRILTKVQE